MKVSPSRLKALDLCSYKFYLNEVLKLPETTHPKALVGTLVHAIFEGYLAKKRSKDLELIVTVGWKGPKLTHGRVRRWCQLFSEHHNIPINADEVIDMLDVAFLSIKPYYSPTWIYYTEKRYEIDFGDFIISGVIDLLIETPEGPVILDLKSQAIRFDKDELKNSYQSISYQLYVWREYKRAAKVVYVLLRHPPTSRTPLKHIQETPKPPESAYKGFEMYLKAMYKYMNGFSLEDAHSNFCEKKWFCEYVCQFKKPFKYNSILNIKDNSVVASYLPGNTPEPTDEQYVEGREFRGCPKFL